MSEPVVDAGNSLVLRPSAATRPDRRLLARLGAMPPWAGGIVGVVVIVLLWFLISVTTFGKNGSIPTPVKVVEVFGQAFQSPAYWEGVSATSIEALEGYLIGNVVALALAFTVLLVPRLEGIATQLAVVTSCLPLTAIGPLAVIMTPAESRTAAVFLAALSVIFTTVVGAILGLKSASRTQLDVISAYGGSRYTQIVKVRLIAALPSLLAALKIAAPAAFLGAILGEFFLVGVDTGIGTLLNAAAFNNLSANVWVLALTSGGIAGLAYFVIDRIGRLLTPWSGDRAGKATL